MIVRLITLACDAPGCDKNITYPDDGGTEPDAWRWVPAPSGQIFDANAYCPEHAPEDWACRPLFTINLAPQERNSLRGVLGTVSDKYRVVKS